MSLSTYLYVLASNNTFMACAQIILFASVHSNPLGSSLYYQYIKECQASSAQLSIPGPPVSSPPLSPPSGLLLRFLRVLLGAKHMLGADTVVLRWVRVK